MQGLQLMGMPHPSIFYYVGYVYKKEGLCGCYRGLVPKICERMIVTIVNERIKKSIEKDSCRPTEDVEIEPDQDVFFQNLMNTVCSQFFAVLASHPFHVLMVTSFSEFTCGKKSTLTQLTRSIFSDEGYFGFFSGLTARLLGELLSMIFSVTYTAIINKQLRPERSVLDINPQPSVQRASHFVNYVTDVSRFTVFKQSNIVEGRIVESTTRDEHGEIQRIRSNGRPHINNILHNFLRIFTHNSSPPNQTILPRGRPHVTSILEYVPLTSKLFYYIMIRDFLSKKISSPFFLVSHCTIVLDSGWDKFPLFPYLDPLAALVQKHLTPVRRSGVKKCMPRN
ncbi:hypothetical protein RUM44_002660 [Polyplax serrata]|uniref:Uncharacterized protein n=1 Tax=Polyplax serrata TaxID=468196 RepID=A0ABR1AFD0_POLSC